MRDNVTYFDKEFGVTRVDLLEAIASSEKARHESMLENRRLLQESNEKLLTRMDAEVRVLRNEIRAVESKIDTVSKDLNTKIDNVSKDINGLLWKLIATGILIPVLLQFVLHIIK